MTAVVGKALVMLDMSSSCWNNEAFAIKSWFMRLVTLQELIILLGSHDHFFNHKIYHVKHIKNTFLKTTVLMIILSNTLLVISILFEFACIKINLFMSLGAKPSNSLTNGHISLNRSPKKLVNPFSYLLVTYTI